mgnify:FL=1
MTDAIVSLSGLTKTFGRRAAVSNVSLEVQRAHICGLIGPNGAGKTTIMKMLAGLCEPASGSMSLFGSGDLAAQRSRVSFMLEAPIIDTALSARDNMRYVQIIRGVADDDRITSLLELVRLDPAEKKSVRKYSLGMKQRLGIAMALLPDPELLVLDEPVNGLDPEGIVEIRLLLRRLSEEQGKTILISSHLLAEMAELCTDYAIINRGALVEQLSHEELLAHCRDHISIRTNDINRTAAVIEEKLGTRSYRVVHGEEIQLMERLDDIAGVSRAITESGLTITRLISEGESLEQYYLSKVGDSND